MSPLPIKRFPWGTAWCCSICLYFSFVSFLLIWTSFPQKKKLRYKPRQSQNLPVFNSRLQPLHVVMFSRSLSYELVPLRCKNFKLRFIRPDNQFHCSVTQSWCCLANVSLFTLFCGLSSGFFAATLPHKPAPIHILHTVLDEMFMFRTALISFVSCWRERERERKPVAQAEKLQVLVLPWGGSSGYIQSWLSGANAENQSRVGF